MFIQTHELLPRFIDVRVQNSFDFYSNLLTKLKKPTIRKRFTHRNEN